MNVLARSSFDRAFRKLSAQQQEQVRAATRLLSSSFGKPHIHTGLGLRRFGRFFEFRAGLDLRVLFNIDEGDAVLLTVGNHDEIRRFVKDNS
jgi:mRNA-degrading endonuclease RelE of RelBE toxin-antitoxin system